ncbi:MAG: Rho termination factor N-terminal domain-containing protein, partial [Lachnospiraceae bacterium]|nr:Rho termination factor N-terminal domain-containing protein [Lachnospiraceae bacterium]
MREKYESLALADLRDIAKSRGIKGVSTMKKGDVVEAMLALDEEERKAKSAAPVSTQGEGMPVSGTGTTIKNIPAGGPARNQTSSATNDAEKEAALSDLDSGITASGILEVMPDGFGFIRSANYLPGENDVYVAPSQIRRFNLKTGDIVTGNTRIKTQAEKFSALLFVKNINGYAPDMASKRYNFEDMTPIFP